MMKTQLEAEADDEYFDDPIKLFDFELERVNFGSRSDTVISNINESKFSPFINLDNDSEDKEVDKHDCMLFVKLVDFRKFPSYFKKYNKQILNNLHTSDPVSYTDYEDILMVELDQIKNNDFCNIHDIENQEVVKCNIDREIQKALSQRNISKVDFKRNKGLIGMTIKQKEMKTVMPYVEFNKTIDLTTDSKKLNDKHTSSPTRTFVVNCTIQEKHVDSKDYQKTPAQLNYTSESNQSTPRNKNMKNKINSFSNKCNNVNKILNVSSLNQALELSRSSNKEISNKNSSNNCLIHLEKTDKYKNSNDNEETVMVMMIYDDIANQYEQQKEYECKIKNSSILLDKTITNLINKKQEVMKNNKDFEIQKALSQRNFSEVDFKRNKGLIGTTIRQKVMKTVLPYHDINKTIKTIDLTTDSKILNDEHTSIPKRTLIVNCTIQQKHIDSKHYQRTSAQLNNISENLHQLSRNENMKNKTNSFSNNCNNVYKDLSASSLNQALELPSFPNKEISNKNSSNNCLIRIEKTDKYKSGDVEDLVKQSTIDTSKNKMIKEKMGDKINDVNIQKDPIESVQNQRDSNSPIIFCSASAKRSNKSLAECQSKIQKSREQDLLTNKSDDFSIIDNQVKIDNSFNVEQSNGTSSKLVVSENTSSSSKLYKNNVSGKDETVKTQLSEINSIYNDNVLKVGQIVNNIPPNSSLHMNKAQKIPPVITDDSEKLSVKIVSVQNIAKSSNSINNKQDTFKKHTVTSSSKAYQCARTPATCDLNPNSSSSGLKSNLPLQNKSAADMNLKYRNNSITARIPCASAIILKPKQPPQSSNKFVLDNPIFNNQKSLNMPLQHPPEFYQNPYSTLYNNCIQYQAKNSNFCDQFSPQRENRYNHYCASQRFQTGYNGSHQRINLCPNRLPRNPRPYIHPYRYAIIPQYAPKKSDVPQCNNFIKDKILPILRSNDYNIQNFQVSSNNTVIDRNSDSLAKNTQIDSRFLQQRKNAALNANNDLSEMNTKIVKSKRETLKGTISNLENGTHKKVSKQTKYVIPVSTINNPEDSNKSNTSTNSDDKQIKKEKGYSPPILPIPTYEMILSRVKNNSQMSDELKHNLNSNKDVKQMTEKCSKRKYNQIVQGNIGNEETKKITLEEYKKRFWF